MIVARSLAATIAIAIIATGAGCPPLPGKPSEKDRWVAPWQVMDFRQLYAQNCAGCHGADGRLGPARPFNDSLYLAFAGADVLRQVTAKRPGHYPFRARTFSSDGQATRSGCRRSSPA